MKKIHSKNIDLDKGKKISLNFGSTILSIVILSSFAKIDKIPNKDIYKLNKVISSELLDDFNTINNQVSDNVSTILFDELPSNMRGTLNSQVIKSKIGDQEISIDFNTFADLYEITEIEFMSKDNYNYEFLNYMPNLEKIIIDDNSTDKNVFNNVDCSSLKKDIDVEIYNSKNTTVFDKKFDFIKSIPHINNLYLGQFNNGMYINSSYLDTLSNVNTLNLSVKLLSDFKHQDFSNFESLIINMPPYDTALYFTNEELENISNSGVNLSVVNYSIVKDINKKIDKIVKNLNIDKDASEQEKLNALLIYILKNFKYDNEVYSYLLIDEDIPKDLLYSFYSEGALTGAIEKETMICGNYSAMTYVLGKRLGLNMYNLISNNHSWNAIKIGDYTYYVDSTYLDSNDIHLFKKNTTSSKNSENGFKTYLDLNSHKPINALDVLETDNQENINYLNWYLDDPTVVNTLEHFLDYDSHIIKYLPEDFEIKPIPLSENIKKESDPTYNYLDNRDIYLSNYQIRMNNIVLYLDACAIIGLLTGLGLAKVVPPKKRKKKDIIEAKTR